MEHIDCQSGGHNTTIRKVFPVDGERIKIVPLEIHHREKGIHQSVAHPALCILTNSGVRIPTTALITGQIVILTNGRARHFHPGLLTLDGPVDLPYDVRDILPSLWTRYLQFPGFRITDIVEVDPIHIIATGHLLTELSQIIACFRLFRIHITLVAHLHNEFGQFLTQLLTAVGVPFPYRDGHDPCVALHSSFVALIDAVLQGVIAWRVTSLTC